MRTSIKEGSKENFLEMMSFLIFNATQKRGNHLFFLGKNVSEKELYIYKVESISPLFFSSVNFLQRFSDFLISKKWQDIPNK